jgi:hypothetical protein
MWCEKDNTAMHETIGSFVVDEHEKAAITKTSRCGQAHRTGHCRA